jgi:hypothetical protein
LHETTLIPQNAVIIAMLSTACVRAAEAFNVTLELVRRGYTEEQIGKVWSGNLLRVWGEVEKTSQKLRKAG